MTSTQRSPHTVSEQLNEDNKNRGYSNIITQLVFCQRHRSSTGYHDRTDWAL